MKFQKLDKKNKIAAGILLSVILIPSLVYAADGHGAHHQASISDLKWFWVNFLIYVGGLFLLLRNPLQRAWIARREVIQGAIAVAKREAEIAHKTLLEADRKLAALPTETAKLANDIEREAVRESADILTQAMMRAERLAAQAKDLAEAERKSTEAAIRHELVGLALKKAEERLRKEMNPATDKAIRETALSSVQQLVQ